jgi:hypothetical protein
MPRRASTRPPASQVGSRVLTATSTTMEGRRRGPQHPGTTRRPPPRLRAAARRVVCGCVPCWGARETGDERRRTPAPAPHPCEHLLTGWFGCYWPRHPHLPRWARQVPRPTTPAPAPHDGRHTTHPQPHEQLLMGWIMGGIAATMTGGSNEGGGRRTTPHHPPSLMSNCSWGGSPVE